MQWLEMVPYKVKQHADPHYLSPCPVSLCLTDKLRSPSYSKGEKGMQRSRLADHGGCSAGTETLDQGKEALFAPVEEVARLMLPLGRSLCRPAFMATHSRLRLTTTYNRDNLLWKQTSPQSWTCKPCTGHSHGSGQPRDALPHS